MKKERGKRGKRGRGEKERKRREIERNAWHEEGSWFRLCSRPRSMLLPWLQVQYRGALLLIIYVKDPSLLRGSATQTQTLANHPQRLRSNLPLAKISHDFLANRDVRTSPDLGPGNPFSRWSN
ncbi:hypothetical protein QLX08_010820 [Tetragonisca angustula]|uniref:Uncharacterized protein n=1 Tax=Tetragonisca angustula TaxID=166442 RepID=A0AAW0ZAG4_9HYME